MTGNENLVRRACAAWGGDLSVYRGMYTPDVTLYVGNFALTLPEGRQTGVDDVMATLQEFVTPFESRELVPERFIEDGDRLVVLVVARAAPRGSSAKVEWRLAMAYRFREGLIAYHGFHPTLEEALEDVGLSEPTRRPTP